MKKLLFIFFLCTTLSPIFGQDKFEGVLCYEFLKESSLKLPNPSADTVFFYVREDRLHMYETGTGLHYIYYMENNCLRETLFSEWCDIAVDVSAAEMELLPEIKVVDLKKKKTVLDMDCSMYRALVYMAGRQESMNDVLVCNDLLMPEAFKYICANTIMGKYADNGLLVRYRTAIIYDKKFTIGKVKYNSYMDLLSIDICSVPDSLMKCPERCQLERVETLPAGQIVSVMGQKYNLERLSAWASVTNKVILPSQRNKPSQDGSNDINYKYEGSWLY